MKFFIYDSTNEKLIINKPEILLVKEISDLMDRGDKKKVNGKTRFYRELTYMFLYIDWESSLSNLPAQERHEEALLSAKLTETEFNDEMFREACRKYEEIQDSNISMRLLKASIKSVESVIYYLNNIDLNERVDGKPVIKTKDLIGEIKGSKDLISALQDLELQVRKDLEQDTGLRGNTESGFYD